MQGTSDTRIQTGDVAHDSVDAGNPVKTGGIARDLAESPTAVAKGDRVDASYDRHGRPFVSPGHPNTTRYHVQRTASGTTTNGIAAPGAGKRIVITAFSIYNDIDSGATSQGKIAFNTGDDVVNHQGIAKGSGIVEANGGAALAIGGDNLGVNVTTDATANVDFHVTYYVMDG